MNNVIFAGNYVTLPQVKVLTFVLLEAGDQATADLLIKILKMEEGHVDWAEIQRTQIEHMGMVNYLVNQTDSQ